MDELQNEKKKVKNELKYYDQAFSQRFNRLPNRTEKEPMRQIYMYYKRLKQYIQRAAQIGGAASQKRTSSEPPREQPSGAGGMMVQQNKYQQQDRS